MRQLLSLIVAAAFLFGCAGAPGTSAPPPTPPLQPYSTAGDEVPKTSQMTNDNVIFETNPGYKGACSPTDTAAWALDAPLRVSLLQAWYNWSNGEMTASYTLEKDGETFLHGALERADCDPYQGGWCNANIAMNREFPEGGYVLTVTGKKMCLPPGKTGTVRIYGKLSTVPSAAN